MTPSPSIADRILEIARRREVIRPRDVVGAVNPSPQFKALVDKGELLKVGRGLYTLARRETSARFTFAQAAARVPDAVVCLISALEFHEFTTQMGYVVWLAIGDKRQLSLSDVPVRVVRMSGASFGGGVEEHETGGMTIRVYSPAKTVADCFKFRRLVGLDVAMEALREGWRQRRFTIDELMHHARIDRVERLMSPYVEMVVA